MKERLPLLIGFLALALAIGLGAVVLADGISDRNRNDVITVTGSAKARIVSDYVVWNASLSSQALTVQDALPDLNRWSAEVRAFLQRQGARPAETSEGPVATETLTNSAGRVTGYRLSRSFEVRSPRIAAVTRIVQESQTLLAAGVPLQAQAPAYSYTQLAQLRPKLLAEAVKDALVRAKVLVGATGGTLGGLRDVNVGVFQVTAPNSTDVSDYGIYDTSTIRKDVTAVVNVSFALS